MAKPRLYALLVGINAYEGNILLAENKVRFPKLRGCVPDTLKMQDYLESETGFDRHIELLTDQAATKTEIARLFLEHLGKAGENDVALFYYSGHGTQEFSQRDLFPDETDGRLEDLVCYYNRETPSYDFLLSDKELRWMINRVSVNKPHILTIFDCCHSGDNTRNASLLKNSFPEVTEKRIPFVFPQRPGNEFLFNGKTDEQVQASTSELGNGLHFQFAACESDESAIEISGEGVFTKTLISVLRACGGNISYHSLGSRIRQFMKNVYEQKPKVYYSGTESAEVFTGFLNKQISGNDGVFGEAVYNENDGWRMNLGTLHGITKQSLPVKISEPRGTSFYEATITSVGLDYAVLSVPGQVMDRNTAYRVVVENQGIHKLRVHFAPGSGNLADNAELFGKIFNDGNTTIVPVNQESEAHYVVRLVNDRYCITHPQDKYRPVVRPIELADPSLVARTLATLQQIARWESLQKLSNTDAATALSANMLKIEIALVGGSYIDAATEERFDLPYSYSNGVWSSSIKIRLTNISDRNLYCAALYLSSDFGCFSRFLDPQVKMLKPGETVDLKQKNKAELIFGLPEEMIYYNWKEQVDHFQFVINTEDFDIASTHLKKPDAPDIPGRIAKATADLRHAITDEEAPLTSGWTTRKISLGLQNPLYGTITEARLRMMLGDPATADFALGLYFDPIEDGFSIRYQYKAGITILPEENMTPDAPAEGVGPEERSVLGDTVINIANWWSRKKRNQYFEAISQRFPDRIKIVSEGDSWFQHPLVMDIIDHLKRIYNIYCVAAAGDTLRNYLGGQHTKGEYFMDAIQTHQPRFFLISGGGNDLLGSQFRSYLVDDPVTNNPQGEAARFLKQELFREIDSLMDIYKTTFLHLQTTMPALQIIVHGYDYPVKLNETNKGWLGRYMIEKGIADPGHRKEVIRLIMDTFNGKLSALAESFSNVTYIDLRNLIRYDEKEKVDQWYDEIHPNNDGFQQLAMKYIQIISEKIANGTNITTHS
jgi:hypothetical protein